MRLTFMVLACATALGAAEVGREVDFIYKIEENSTAAREYRGEIPTVFWDIRLGVDVIRPGLPLPWPHATVSAQVCTKRYYWADASLLVNPPYSAFTPYRSKAPEDRIEYAATYTQSLWTPLPWDAQFEIQACGVHRTLEVQRAGTTKEYADSFLVSDPRALLLLPVYQERYAGILIGGGVTVPIGEDSDWIHAHGRTGWLATARWSGALPVVPCSSFMISATYIRVADSENKVYTASTAVAPIGSPGGPVTVSHDYTGWEAGASIWHRPWTNVGIGAIGSIERHVYEDGRTNTGVSISEEHVVTSNLGPALRLSWKRSHLTIAVTTDLLTNNDQSHAWQGTCAVEIGTW